MTAPSLTPGAACVWCQSHNTRDKYRSRTVLPIFVLGETTAPSATVAAVGPQTDEKALVLVRWQSYYPGATATALPLTLSAGLTSAKSEMTPSPVATTSVMVMVGRYSQQPRWPIRVANLAPIKDQGARGDVGGFAGVWGWQNATSLWPVVPEMKPAQLFEALRAK